MKNETEAGLAFMTLAGIAAALIACSVMSGCSYKTEILWHGKTPIGLDNRQATALMDAEEHEQRGHRVVRVND